MSCSREEFRKVVESLNDDLDNPDENLIFFYYFENQNTFGIKLSLDRKHRTTFPIILNFPKYDSKEKIRRACYDKLEEIENIFGSIKNMIEDSQDKNVNNWFD